MNAWEIEYQNPQLRIWRKEVPVDMDMPAQFEYKEQRIQAMTGVALVRRDSVNRILAAARAYATEIAIAAVEAAGGEMADIPVHTEIKKLEEPDAGHVGWAEFDEAHAVVGYWPYDPELEEQIGGGWVAPGDVIADMSRFPGVEARTERTVSSDFFRQPRGHEVAPDFVITDIHQPKPRIVKDTPQA